MGKLSEEVKKAVSEIHPGLIATSSRGGLPNVSAKGSFRVWDDDHVVFAEINSPRTLRNLQGNNQISIMVLDPATRHGARIWGRAEIKRSGEVFDKLSAEYAPRNITVKNAVIVTVDEAVAF
ncbi:MAG: pyridoxamine 5'-phosphate oxidase family protein [Chloroflexi bacterium]|nr:pyridoxamine 5'-phosphate oxidase family protein [Chloroflexota bacterium]